MKPVADLSGNERGGQMTETRRIPKRERQQRILAKLRAYNALQISDLIASLAPFPEGIERDIQEVHQTGIAQRHAAATAKSSEPAGTERNAVTEAAPRKLAALAMRFIQPHMVLMIDGSATLHLARRLATDAQNITVITNSLSAATLLGANPTISVTFCPGRYDSRHATVAGLDTIRFLGRFRANLAIVSAGGITEDGPTCGLSDSMATKRAMLKRSEERIVLLDHSKSGRCHPQLVCPLGDIDQLVCDEVPDAKLCSALHKAQVEVHY
jgi:DeoR/GlpR family transcriptional regulator of sugar metabolism